MCTHFITSIARRVAVSDSQLKSVDLGTPSFWEMERRLQPLARNVTNALLRSSFTEGRKGREAGGESSTTDFTDAADGAEQGPAEAGTTSGVGTGVPTLSLEVAEGEGWDSLKFWFLSRFGFSAVNAEVRRSEEDSTTDFTDDATADSSRKLLLR